ncbi:MAG: hypothetical protein HYY24_26355 [Verrucomicrobia bacterium]|nr:hypothetical protein [Verrucomicrobiota bacterium]
MTLRWRAFEKVVRRRVRLELRASPALWREYKRVRKRPAREVGPWVLRAMLTVALGVLIAATADHGVPLAGQLGLVTCWCIGWSLYYAALLRAHLYSYDALVLAVLPLPPDAVFRQQWKQFRLGTWWTLVDVGVAFSVIGALTAAAPPAWLAALSALGLHWLGTLALAGLLVTFWPKAPYGLGYQALLFLLFGIAIAGQWVAPPLLGLLDKLTPALQWAPPFGWINFAVRRVVESEWSALGFLFPILGLLLLALRFAQRRLAAAYAVEEFVADAFSGRAGLEPADQEAPLAEGADGRAPSRSEAELALPRGALRANGDVARRGWLERLAFAWFTPRERTLAEFMSAGQLRWTGALWTGTGFTALALLAGATLGGAGEAIFFIGLFIALTAAVPLLAFGFSAFSTVPQFSASFPVYAGLPLGYWELSRLLLKVSLLRIAAFTPVALAAGWASEWIFPPAAFGGVQLAIRIMAVLLCWQPTLAALQFSSGTNDTRRGFWRTLKLLSFFLPLVLAMVGLSAVCLLVPTPWIAAGSALGTGLLSLGVLACYGRLYNRNAFDLMQGAPQ